MKRIVILNILIIISLWSIGQTTKIDDVEIKKTAVFNGPMTINNIIKLNGSAGTVGQTLVSQGSSLPPVWYTPSGGSISRNIYTTNGTIDPGSSTGRIITIIPNKTFSILAHNTSTGDTSYSSYSGNLFHFEIDKDYAYGGSTAGNIINAMNINEWYTSVQSDATAGAPRVSTIFSIDGTNGVNLQESGTYKPGLQYISPDSTQWLPNTLVTKKWVTDVTNVTIGLLALKKNIVDSVGITSNYTTGYRNTLNIKYTDTLPKYTGDFKLDIASSTGTYLWQTSLQYAPTYHNATSGNDNQNAKDFNTSIYWISQYLIADPSILLSVQFRSGVPNKIDTFYFRLRAAAFGTGSYYFKPYGGTYTATSGQKFVLHDSFLNTNTDISSSFFSNSLASSPGYAFNTDNADPTTTGNRFYVVVFPAPPLSATPYYVNNNFNPASEIKINGISGAPGQVISSNGPNVAPSWLTPGTGSSYTLPTATTTTLGGIKIGNDFSIISGVLNAHPNVVTVGSVPYLNNAGIMVEDNTGFNYDGNNLTVGHSGFNNTVGLLINGGRASITGSGTGMILTMAGGTPVDPSKVFRLKNSLTEYLRAYTTGTSYADWKSYIDIFTNFRVRGMSVDSTAPITRGTPQMVVTDQDGQFSFRPVPTVGATPSLQSVTDVAAYTTNSITSYNTSGGYHSAGLGYDSYSGSLDLLNISNKSVSLRSKNVDSPYVIDFPILHIPLSSRAVLPVSVNGNFADVNGNIVVTGTGGGMSAISVATANGFGGTSSGGTTPVLTLTTPLTGILKGNGTAMLAAVPGTDFVTIPQLGTKVDTSYKTHLALPLSLRLADTTLQISKATTSTDGYLSSVDWNTFNGKENSLGNPSTNGYVLSSTTGGVRSWIAPATGGGGGTWGSITGTLSSQTDLQSALNGKQATLGFTPYNATNPSGYISSYTETDPIVKAINGIVKSNGTTISAATAGIDYVIPSGSITGNAATVTTNANLTGPVTSTGNVTAIGTGAISNTMLANTAVALLSGTNSGDNATNTQYSGLVTNATHTGDATGSTVLTVVKINGTLLAGLTTGLLKNTTSTGVPSIAVSGTDYALPNANTTGTAGGLSVILPIANGGTGTATPGIVAGTNITVSGSWPNQTVNSTGGSSGTTDYQSQTATAAQTAFTFTSVPASYNDYWLDINGAVIQQSYYTTSGNIITFTSALTLSDKVQYHRIK
jgi:hypothetical protein